MCIALPTAHGEVANPSTRPATAAQLIVHLLDYIAVDYAAAVRDGTIIAPTEYAEQREFAGQVAELVAQLPERPEQAALLGQARQLVALVEAKAPTAQIAAIAGSLHRDLVAAYDVVVAPQAPPDLARGKTLFASQCASCHGAHGAGDGPLATKLVPPPSDFHDRERQAKRSAHSLYGTITLGVPGTAMAPFGALSDADRWALAFFVANLADDDAARAAGAKLWGSGRGRELLPDLRALATATPAALRETHGEEGAQLLAFLRAQPKALINAGESPLEFATRTLHASATAYRRGAVAQARDLAVSAYLDGFELVEGSLAGQAPELKDRIEREMMAFRNLIQSRAAPEAVDAKAGALSVALAEAGNSMERDASSAAATFASAFVILFREGLEAILVLAGMLAFLAKTGQRRGAAYVHAGWVAALALGAATWFAASYLIGISGAGRETTEGVTALISAVVLLYMGYWLHGKMYARRWQEFVGSQVRQAMSRGTLWGLALVAFFAVYREAFETVLFYQTLWAQTQGAGRGALLAGFGSGVVALAALGWMLLRYSVRLPLGLFFGAASLMLAALAVVFAGKGVFALQAAGKLPVHELALPALPALGFYPNLQTLLAQLILLALVLVAFAFNYWSGRPQPASSRREKA
jgi:high-affinity iron transporter